MNLMLQSLEYLSEFKVMLYSLQEIYSSILVRGVKGHIFNSLIFDEEKVPKDE